MAASISQRWVRGFGLSFYAAILLGIAWGIPRSVAELLEERPGVPESLRTAILIAWAVAMLVFCPLAFEWLTRKVGITMQDRREVEIGERLSGHRVTATPVGDGKKKCAGCGSIVTEYAVRCHQCKGVFVGDAELQN